MRIALPAFNKHFFLCVTPVITKCVGAAVYIRLAYEPVPRFAKVISMHDNHSNQEDLGVL